MWPRSTSDHRARWSNDTYRVGLTAMIARARQNESLREMLAQIQPSDRAHATTGVIVAASLLDSVVLALSRRATVLCDALVALTSAEQQRMTATRHEETDDDVA